MLASEVKLVPITEEQRDKASVREICEKLLSSGEIQDPYAEPKGPVATVSGECLQLNMADSKDRETYADLAAEAVAKPDEVVILWEERVKCDNGGLVIYLCYVKKLKMKRSSLEAVRR